MEKYFVTYNQALALKEMGFDEPCFKYVYTGDTANNIDRYLETEPTRAKKYNDESLCVSQPLKSQVFEWFRKEYSGIVNIQHYGGLRFPDICFNYKITAVNNAPSKILSRVFDTYEEAESACIDKLIEIINKK